MLMVCILGKVILSKLVSFLLNMSVTSLNIKLVLEIKNFYRRIVPGILTGIYGFADTINMPDLESFQPPRN